MLWDRQQIRHKIDNVILTFSYPLFLTGKRSWYGPFTSCLCGMWPGISLRILEKDISKSLGYGETQVSIGWVVSGHLCRPVTYCSVVLLVYDFLLIVMLRDRPKMIQRLNTYGLFHSEAGRVGNRKFSTDWSSGRRWFFT